MRTRKDPNSPWSIGPDAEREAHTSDIAFLNDLVAAMVKRWPQPDARESGLIVSFACHLLSRCVEDDYADDEVVDWIISKVKAEREHQKTKAQQRRRRK